MSETEIYQRIRAVEESAKQAHKRLDSVERTQDVLHDLASSVSVLTERIGHVQKDTAEITARLTAIEDQPKRRWDALIGAIIGAAMSGIIGYIIGQLVR